MSANIKVSLPNPLTSEAEPFTEGIYNTIPLSAKDLFTEPVTAVSEYPAPREAPLSYPGTRPETSFTNGVGAEVWPVMVRDDPETGETRFFIKSPSGVWDLDDALEGAHAPKMEDRVPVVTFGSNANPGQLLNKFKDLESVAEQQIVPTTKATLHNGTPVYVPKIGIWNYSFADLYPEEGADTEVFVNWLSPAQLEKMHKSEKAYIFCEYGTVELEGTDMQVPAYLYAGNVSAYLGEDGKPVRLSTVSTTNSKLRELTQQEIQQELLEATVDHVIDSFEHIQEEIGEDTLSVEGLHLVIQEMTNHVGANGEKLKKGLIGNAMADYLAQIGRAAPVSLLSVISKADQNVTPLTFREIKKAKS